MSDTEVVIRIESFIINEDGAWVHLITKPPMGGGFISPLKPGDELRIQINPTPVFTVVRKEKETDE